MVTDTLAVDAAQPREQEGRRLLFVGCFIALVATSFAFIIRVMVMDQWQIAFGLTETEKGQIFGAGMWPFGMSIVVFSLIIDRIGYGKAMIFAFVCHLFSTVLLVSAQGYWWLYWGSILNGLAAGTVEAVINPAVATMYPKKKTTMLSVLHAGWPGGFVLGGVMIMGMRPLGITAWQVKVGIILLPVVLYGLFLLKCRFPVHERVKAGIPYRDMLKEAGTIGALICLYMILMEINRLLGLPNLVDTTFLDLPSLPITIVLVVLTAVYLAYTKSAGRPMYIFLLLVMILLAITELGTDTWIKELMGPAMKTVGLDAGWVLIYTATIMMILRFCIAPIERLLRPLGVLFVSALLATVGLYFLPQSQGIMILVFATVYGMGQCFFWPVTLGLVAEQFPRGGALTLNAIAGVGMIGVGIIGAQLLGFWQDTYIDATVQQEHPAAYERLMTDEAKESVFGDYRALDGSVVNEVNDRLALYRYRQEQARESGLTGEALTATLADDPEYQVLVQRAYDHIVREAGDDAESTFQQMHAALETRGLIPDEAEEVASLSETEGIIEDVRAEAKKHAMMNVAALPLVMAACYLGLMLYFRAKGGYKVVELTPEGEVAGTHRPTAEEAEADAEKGPQR